VLTAKPRAPDGHRGIWASFCASDVPASTGTSVCTSPRCFTDLRPVVVFQTSGFTGQIGEFGHLDSGAGAKCACFREQRRQGRLRGSFARPLSVTFRILPPPSLPTISVNYRRPQTDSALETFIRAKYEQKRYAMKDWQPPKIDVKSLLAELENFHARKKISSSPALSSLVEKSATLNVAQTAGRTSKGANR